VGGVTGRRCAWLKANGEIQHYDKTYLANE
jgi:hypothetical protein